MRTLDLGYWEGEKECFICGAGSHYSKDCEHKDKPNVKFRAFHRKNPETTLGHVEAQHSYRASQDAQSFRSDTVPWHEIEVEQVNG